MIKRHNMKNDIIQLKSNLFFQKKTIILKRRILVQFKWTINIIPLPIENGKNQKKLRKIK